MTQLPPDGLLYNPEVTTQEEIDAYRKFYIATKGYSLPAFEFWLQLRPDVLKRYRANFVRETTSAEEKPRPLSHVIAMLHYYAVVGFEDGILYEIKLSRTHGATRGEVMDTLAFAFIHGAPLGMTAVAESSMEYMKEWKDEPSARADRWPSGWSFDARAFASGMDFSSPEPTKRDMEALQDWYRAKLGEVPRYVTFLAKHRPGFLKSYRNRFENALREGLPKPLPVIDHLSAPFWEGCKAHELRLQRCRACGALRFPAGPLCLQCRSAEADWIRSKGRGRVYSWPTNIVDCPPEGVTAGMPVQVVFRDINEDVSLPQFKPSAGRA